jgi:surfactin family lipopeptide synthetase A
VALKPKAQMPNNPLIAIAVERSLEMVIGLLGILKAGGAYVPIDPSYPAARIRYMLEDSAAPLLLTQSHLKAVLPALEHDCVLVCLDEAAKFASQPTTNLAIGRSTTDLAYVIYTSGSTGKPKGVMIEHSALSNFIHSSTNNYLITSDDKILQFSSVSFDAAAEEIYPTLTQGATLVLRTTEVLNRLETFLGFCANLQLTVLYLPTAYWHHLLVERPETWKHWPDCLRLILIGGEAASGEAVKQWMQYFRNYPALINEYGPTETTIVTAYCHLGEVNLTTVPIGQPIANTRFYILSAQHQPQPPGIPGELCIAGRGLARGYLNRPELTAEKFVEVELFGKTERIYKTKRVT